MQNEGTVFHYTFFSIPVPPMITPITFGPNIFDEGSSAQILCSVSAGDEPLSITWSFHGNDINSGSSGIVTSNFGSKTSFLMINSVNQVSWRRTESPFARACCSSSPR